MTLVAPRAGECLSLLTPFRALPCQAVLAATVSRGMLFYLVETALSVSTFPVAED